MNDKPLCNSVLPVPPWFRRFHAKHATADDKHKTINPLCNSVLPVSPWFKGFMQNVKKLIRQVFELFHISDSDFPFPDLY